MPRPRVGLPSTGPLPKKHKGFAGADEDEEEEEAGASAPAAEELIQSDTEPQDLWDDDAVMSTIENEGGDGHDEGMDDPAGDSWETDDDEGQL